MSALTQKKQPKINSIFVFTLFSKAETTTTTTTTTAGESMTRFERDAEYEAYIGERRLLSERLHDHWKRDLNQHV